MLSHEQTDCRHLQTVIHLNAFFENPELYSSSNAQCGLWLNCYRVCEVVLQKQFPNPEEQVGPSVLYYSLHASVTGQSDFQPVLHGEVVRRDYCDKDITILQDKLHNKLLHIQTTLFQHHAELSFLCAGTLDNNTKLHLLNTLKPGFSALVKPSLFLSGPQAAEQPQETTIFGALSYIQHCLQDAPACIPSSILILKNAHVSLHAPLHVPNTTVYTDTTNIPTLHKFFTQQRVPICIVNISENTVQYDRITSHTRVPYLDHYPGQSIPHTMVYDKLEHFLQACMSNYTYDVQEDHTFPFLHAFLQLEERPETVYDTFLLACQPSIIQTLQCNTAYLQSRMQSLGWLAADKDVYCYHVTSEMQLVLRFTGGTSCNISFSCLNDRLTKLIHPWQAAPALQVSTCLTEDDILMHMRFVVNSIMMLSSSSMTLLDSYTMHPSSTRTLLFSKGQQEQLQITTRADPMGMDAELWLNAVLYPSLSIDLLRKLVIDTLRLVSVDANIFTCHNCVIELVTSPAHIQFTWYALDNNTLQDCIEQHSTLLQDLVWEYTEAPFRFAVGKTGSIPTCTLVSNPVVGHGWVTVPHPTILDISPISSTTVTSQITGDTEVDKNITVEVELDAMDDDVAFLLQTIQGISDSNDSNSNNLDDTLLGSSNNNNTNNNNNKSITPLTSTTPLFSLVYPIYTPESHMLGLLASLGPWMQRRYLPRLPIWTPPILHLPHRNRTWVGTMPLLLTRAPQPVLENLDFVKLFIPYPETISYPLRSTIETLPLPFETTSPRDIPMLGCMPYHCVQHILRLRAQEGYTPVSWETNLFPEYMQQVKLTVKHKLEENAQSLHVDAIHALTSLEYIQFVNQVMTMKHIVLTYITNMYNAYTMAFLTNMDRSMEDPIAESSPSASPGTCATSTGGGDAAATLLRKSRKKLRYIMQSLKSAPSKTCDVATILQQGQWPLLFKITVFHKLFPQRTFLQQSMLQHTVQQYLDNTFVDAQDVTQPHIRQSDQKLLVTALNAVTVAPAPFFTGAWCKPQSETHQSNQVYRAEMFILAEKKPTHLFKLVIRASLYLSDIVGSSRSNTQDCLMDTYSLIAENTNKADTVALTALRCFQEMSHSNVALDDGIHSALSPSSVMYITPGTLAAAHFNAYLISIQCKAHQLFSIYKPHLECNFAILSTDLAAEQSNKQVLKKQVTPLSVCIYVNILFLLSRLDMKSTTYQSCSELFKQLHVFIPSHRGVVPVPNNVISFAQENINNSNNNNSNIISHSHNTDNDHTDNTDNNIQDSTLQNNILQPLDQEVLTQAALFSKETVYQHCLPRFLSNFDELTNATDTLNCQNTFTLPMSFQNLLQTSQCIPLVIPIPHGDKAGLLATQSRNYIKQCLRVLFPHTIINDILYAGSYTVPNVMSLVLQPPVSEQILDHITVYLLQINQHSHVHPLLPDKSLHPLFHASLRDQPPTVTAVPRLQSMEPYTAKVLLQYLDTLKARSEQMRLYACLLLRIPVSRNEQYAAFNDSYAFICDTDVTVLQLDHASWPSKTYLNSQVKSDDNLSSQGKLLNHKNLKVKTSALFNSTFRSFRNAWCVEPVSVSGFPCCDKERLQDSSCCAIQNQSWSNFRSLSGGMHSYHSYYPIEEDTLVTIDTSRNANSGKTDVFSTALTTSQRAFQRHIQHQVNEPLSSLFSRVANTDLYVYTGVDNGYTNPADYPCHSTDSTPEECISNTLPKSPLFIRFELVCGSVETEMQGHVCDGGEVNPHYQSQLVVPIAHDMAMLPLGQILLKSYHEVLQSHCASGIFCACLQCRCVQPRNSHKHIGVNLTGQTYLRIHSYFLPKLHDHDELKDVSGVLNTIQQLARLSPNMLYNQRKKRQETTLPTQEDPTITPTHTCCSPVPVLSSSVSHARPAYSFYWTIPDSCLQPLCSMQNSRARAGRGGTNFTVASFIGNSQQSVYLGISEYEEESTKMNVPVTHIDGINVHSEATLTQLIGRYAHALPTKSRKFDLQQISAAFTRIQPIPVLFTTRVMGLVKALVADEALKSLLETFMTQEGTYFLQKVREARKEVDEPDVVSEQEADDMVDIDIGASMCDSELDSELAPSTTASIDIYGGQSEQVAITLPSNVNIAPSEVDRVFKHVTSLSTPSVFSFRLPITVSPSAALFAHQLFPSALTRTPIEPQQDYSDTHKNNAHVNTNVRLGKDNVYFKAINYRNRPLMYLNRIPQLGSDANSFGDTSHVKASIPLPSSASGNTVPSPLHTPSGAESPLSMASVAQSCRNTPTRSDQAISEQQAHNYTNSLYSEALPSSSQPFYSAPFWLFVDMHDSLAGIQLSKSAVPQPEDENHGLYPELSELSVNPQFLTDKGDKLPRLPAALHPYFNCKDIPLWKGHSELEIISKVKAKQLKLSWDIASMHRKDKLQLAKLLRDCTIPGQDVQDLVSLQNMRKTSTIFTKHKKLIKSLRRFRKMEVPVSSMLGELLTEEKASESTSTEEFGFAQDSLETFAIPQSQFDCVLGRAHTVSSSSQRYRIVNAHEMEKQVSSKPYVTDSLSMLQIEDDVETESEDDDDDDTDYGLSGLFDDHKCVSKEGETALATSKQHNFRGHTYLSNTDDLGDSYVRDHLYVDTDRFKFVDEENPSQTKEITPAEPHIIYVTVHLHATSLPLWFVRAILDAVRRAMVNAIRQVNQRCLLFSAHRHKIISPLLMIPDEMRDTKPIEPPMLAPAPSSISSTDTVIVPPTQRGNNLGGSVILDNSTIYRQTPYLHEANYEDAALTAAAPIQHQLDSSNSYRCSLIAHDITRLFFTFPSLPKPASLACPFSTLYLLPIPSRLRAQDLVKTLTAKLEPFKVGNRNNTFVYKEESGNVSQFSLDIAATTSLASWDMQGHLRKVIGSQRNAWNSRHSQRKLHQKHNKTTEEFVSSEQACMFCVQTPQTKLPVDAVFSSVKVAPPTEPSVQDQELASSMFPSLALACSIIPDPSSFQFVLSPDHGVTASTMLSDTAKNNFHAQHNHATAVEEFEIYTSQQHRLRNMLETTHKSSAQNLLVTAPLVKLDSFASFGVNATYLHPSTQTAVLSQLDEIHNAQQYTYKQLYGTSRQRARFEPQLKSFCTSCGSPLVSLPAVDTLPKTRGKTSAAYYPLVPTTHPSYSLSPCPSYFVSVNVYSLQKPGNDLHALINNILRERIVALTSMALADVYVKSSQKVKLSVSDVDFLRPAYKVPSFSTVAPLSLAQLTPKKSALEPHKVQLDLNLSVNDAFLFLSIANNLLNEVFKSAVVTDSKTVGLPAVVNQYKKRGDGKSDPGAPHSRIIASNVSSHVLLYNLSSNTAKGHESFTPLVHLPYDSSIQHTNTPQVIQSILTKLPERPFDTLVNVSASATNDLDAFTSGSLSVPNIVSDSMKRAAMLTNIPICSTLAAETQGQVHPRDALLESLLPSVSPTNQSLYMVYVPPSSRVSSLLPRRDTDLSDVGEGLGLISLTLLAKDFGPVAAAPSVVPSLVNTLAHYTTQPPSGPAKHTKQLDIREIEEEMKRKASLPPPCISNTQPCVSQLQIALCNNAILQPILHAVCCGDGSIPAKKEDASTISLTNAYPDFILEDCKAVDQAIRCNPSVSAALQDYESVALVLEEDIIYHDDYVLLPTGMDSDATTEECTDTGYWQSNYAEYISSTPMKSPQLSIQNSADLNATLENWDLHSDMSIWEAHTASFAQKDIPKILGITLKDKDLSLIQLIAGRTRGKPIGASEISFYEQLEGMMHKNVGADRHTEESLYELEPAYSTASVPTEDLLNHALTFPEGVFDDAPVIADTILKPSSLQIFGMGVSSHGLDEPAMRSICMLLEPGNTLSDFFDGNQTTDQTMFLYDGGKQTRSRIPTRSKTRLNASQVEDGAFDFNVVDVLNAPVELPAALAKLKEIGAPEHTIPTFEAEMEQLVARVAPYSHLLLPMSTLHLKPPLLKAYPITTHSKPKNLAQALVPQANVSGGYLAGLQRFSVEQSTHKNTAHQTQTPGSLFSQQLHDQRKVSSAPLSTAHYSILIEIHAPKTMNAHKLTSIVQRILQNALNLYLIEVVLLSARIRYHAYTQAYARYTLVQAVLARSAQMTPEIAQGIYTKLDCNPLPPLLGCASATLSPLLSLLGSSISESKNPYIERIIARVSLPAWILPQFIQSQSTQIGTIQALGHEDDESVAVTAFQVYKMKRHLSASAQPGHRAELRLQSDLATTSLADKTPMFNAQLTLDHHTVVTKTHNGQPSVKKHFPTTLEQKLLSLFPLDAVKNAEMCELQAHVLDQRERILTDASEGFVLMAGVGLQYLIECLFDKDNSARAPAHLANSTQDAVNAEVQHIGSEAVFATTHIKDLSLAGIHPDLTSTASLTIPTPICVQQLHSLAVDPAADTNTRVNNESFVGTELVLLPGSDKLNTHSPFVSKNAKLPTIVSGKHKQNTLPRHRAVIAVVKDRRLLLYTLNWDAKAVNTLVSAIQTLVDRLGVEYNLIDHVLHQNLGLSRIISAPPPLLGMVSLTPVDMLAKFTHCILKGQNLQQYFSAKTDNAAAASVLLVSKQLDSMKMEHWEHILADQGTHLDPVVKSLHTLPYVRLFFLPLFQDGFVKYMLGQVSQSQYKALLLRIYAALVTKVAVRYHEAFLTKRNLYIGKVSEVENASRLFNLAKAERRRVIQITLGANEKHKMDKHKNHNTTNRAVLNRKAPVLLPKTKSVRFMHLDDTMSEGRASVSSDLTATSQLDSLHKTDYDRVQKSYNDAVLAAYTVQALLKLARECWDQVGLLENPVQANYTQKDLYTLTHSDLSSQKPEEDDSLLDRPAVCVSATVNATYKVSSYIDCFTSVDVSRVTPFTAALQLPHTELTRITSGCAEVPAIIEKQQMYTDSTTSIFSTSSDEFANLFLALFQKPSRVIPASTSLPVSRFVCDYTEEKTLNPSDSLYMALHGNTNIKIQCRADPRVFTTVPSRSLDLSQIETSSLLPVLYIPRLKKHIIHCLLEPLLLGRQHLLELQQRKSILQLAISRYCIWWATIDFQYQRFFPWATRKFYTILDNTATPVTSTEPADILTGMKGTSSTESTTNVQVVKIPTLGNSDYSNTRIPPFLFALPLSKATWVYILLSQCLTIHHTQIPLISPFHEISEDLYGQNELLYRRILMMAAETICTSRGGFPLAYDDHNLFYHGNENQVTSKLLDNYLPKQIIISIISEFATILVQLRVDTVPVNSNYSSPAHNANNNHACAYHDSIHCEHGKILTTTNLVMTWYYTPIPSAHIITKRLIDQRHKNHFTNPPLAFINPKQHALTLLQSKVTSGLQNLPLHILQDIAKLRSLNIITKIKSPSLYLPTSAGVALSAVPIANTVSLEHLVESWKNWSAPSINTIYTWPQTVVSAAYDQYLQYSSQTLPSMSAMTNSSARMEALIENSGLKGKAIHTYHTQYNTSSYTKQQAEYPSLSSVFTTDSPKLTAKKQAFHISKHTPSMQNLNSQVDQSIPRQHSSLSVSSSQDEYQPSSNSSTTPPLLYPSTFIPQLWTISSLMDTPGFLDSSVLMLPPLINSAALFTMKPQSQKHIQDLGSELKADTNFSKLLLSNIEFITANTLFNTTCPSNTYIKTSLEELAIRHNLLVSSSSQRIKKNVHISPYTAIYHPTEHPSYYFERKKLHVYLDFDTLRSSLTPLKTVNTHNNKVKMFNSISNTITFLRYLLANHSKLIQNNSANENHANVYLHESSLITDANHSYPSLLLQTPKMMLEESQDITYNMARKLDDTRLLSCICFNIANNECGNTNSDCNHNNSSNNSNNICICVDISLICDHNRYRIDEIMEEVVKNIAYYIHNSLKQFCKDLIVYKLTQKRPAALSPSDDIQLSHPIHQDGYSMYNQNIPYVIHNTTSKEIINKYTNSPEPFQYIIFTLTKYINSPASARRGNFFLMEYTLPMLIALRSMITTTHLMQSDAYLRFTSLQLQVPSNILVTQNNNHTWSDQLSQLFLRKYRLDSTSSENMLHIGQFLIQLLEKICNNSNFNIKMCIIEQIIHIFVFSEKYSLFWFVHLIFDCTGNYNKHKKPTFEIELCYLSDLYNQTKPTDNFKTTTAGKTTSPLNTNATALFQSPVQVTYINEELSEPKVAVLVNTKGLQTLCEDYYDTSAIKSTDSDKEDRNLNHIQPKVYKGEFINNNIVELCDLSITHEAELFVEDIIRLFHEFIWEYRR